MYDGADSTWCRLLAVLCVWLGAPQLTHGQSQVVEQTAAIAVAQERGWLIRANTVSGGALELKWLADDIPLYYQTHNEDAARTLGTDAVRPGGALGLSLTGLGETIGIWDGGRVRGTHQEFTGRAIPMDGFPAAIEHATHVAGTIIGAGLSPAEMSRPAGQSLGMAYEANLNTFDFTFDESEMVTSAQAGLTLSNHSYGIVTGWIYDDFDAGLGWYWFGDVTVSAVEDYFFGFYSFHAQRWDDIAFDHPNYLIVKSAGNDRNDFGPTSGSHYVVMNGLWTLSSAVRNADGNDGYDSISHAAVSKNVLTVGAVFDVPNGYTNPGDVVMTDFSGWGPTDDGRIKPDVVANGKNLWSATSESTTSYAGRSGTSMSTASTTGSLALLTQHYRETHGGGTMSAAMLKGLVIHTANESGAFPGPDCQFGWGLVNTQGAADHISISSSNPHAMQALTLGQGQVVTQTVMYDGSGPMKVTVSWTDPPGTSPPSQLDPTTPMLVNDLDLRVIDPTGVTHEPWRLNVGDPGGAAIRGDNTTDNIEMVLIDAPVPGAYQILVRHKGTLDRALQPFAMLLSGGSSNDPITGACCNLLACTETTTELTCLGGGGTWYGGGDCGTFACPPVGACCVGCPPEAVCDVRDEASCTALAGAWSAGTDCIGATCTPDNDECAMGAMPVPDGTYAIDNRCATTDGPDQVDCDTGLQPFSRDVWFHYSATCTGTLTVSMCGDADYDGIIALYTDGSGSCSCPVDATNQDGLCGDDTCGLEGGPSTVSRFVNEGQCMTVRVGGWSNQSGTGSVDIRCAPEICPATAPPVPEPDPIDKNRYLALMPGLNDEPTALRLTADTLPGFSQFQGVTLWLGPATIAPDPDFADPERTFVVSHLQCEPYFADWNTTDPLCVVGAEILPLGSYRVQALRSSCADSMQDESVYSPSLPLRTSTWADVVPEFAGAKGAIQPDFQDIAAEVAGFLRSPNAISKSRSQLRPNVPRVTMPIDFKDIFDSVQAFLGQSYPYSGPCTCPSLVTCGAAACTIDLDCNGGVCFESFCRDSCSRCRQP